MADDAQSKIDEQVKNHRVMVFMKGTPDAPQCGFSAATVEILRKHPYPYKSIDILGNPEIRATLPTYSNWPTFPQLFIGGKLVGGCDIVHELENSGELEKLLKAAFEEK